MAITHIVMLQFKPSVSSVDVEEVCTIMVQNAFFSILRKGRTRKREESIPNRLANIDSQACQRMLGLKQGCLHPQTKKPYIKSLTGGKDISLDGLQVLSPQSLIFYYVTY